VIVRPVACCVELDRDHLQRQAQVNCLRMRGRSGARWVAASACRARMRVLADVVGLAAPLNSLSDA
jgi:hypothetical protein